MCLFRGRNDLSMNGEDRMRYRRSCGAEYAVIPKEVPLAKEEVIFCQCGRMLQGSKHSTISITNP